MLAGGDEYVAVLYDRASQFERQEFCLDCWADRQGRLQDAFSTWRGRVPMPEEPKSKLVSDEVLIEFFEKLEGLEEASKINLRFVLGLMLMRKKLLVYEGSGTDQHGRELWSMRFRADSRPLALIRPALSQQQITEVSAQLRAIFEVPA